MNQFDQSFGAFFGEVVATGFLYSLLDDDGIPTPKARGGVEPVMPCWSSQQRVEVIIANVPGAHDHRPIRIVLAEFEKTWLPGIERDGYLLGINWINNPPEGYDITPKAFLEHLERAR